LFHVRGGVNPDDEDLAGKRRAYANEWAIMERGAHERTKLCFELAYVQCQSIPKNKKPGAKQAFSKPAN